MRRIYTASSWRNTLYPAVVKALRGDGHELYDFRGAEADNGGFRWSAIDPMWKAWTQEQFVEMLKHPLACEGFKRDKDALDWGDTCVLILPCGKSAHLELGYAAGRDKDTHILLDRYDPGFEPELMYKFAPHVHTHPDDLRAALMQPCPSSLNR